MTERTSGVLVHPDKQALAGSVAARFITKIARHPRRRRRRRTSSLTGGSMGARGARGRRRLPRARQRRLVARALLVGRRALAARAATPTATTSRRATRCSTHLDMPGRERAPVPRVRRRASTSTTAADAYAAELAAHGADGAPLPALRHHASSASGPTATSPRCSRDRSGIQVTDRAVIAVRNSPKPPPERAQPHAAGDQRVAARSGWCSPAPTRPRRSGSPSPARAATRCRSRASRAAGARCSSSTGRRGRGARVAHRARLLSSRDDSRRRTHEGAGHRPAPSRVCRRRQSSGA